METTTGPGCGFYIFIYYGCAINSIEGHGS